MTLRRRTSLLVIAMIAVTITACSGGGGGGGGGSASAPVPTPAPPPTTPEPATRFTLSGTVTASASQAVDSDNNDPAGTAISNDSPATAQAIPNPITLGGYINQPGSGAEGRSRLSGDIDDFFRVELLAGQRITMIVADFQQADADLYLYDALGNVVDFSLDTGEVESLIVPADGTYLVNAFAFRGATNYILAIGAVGGATATNRYRDIVPWQTVVKYREGAGPVGETTGNPAIMRRLALEQRGGGRGRGRLLALRRTALAIAERSSQLGPAVAKAEHIADRQLRNRWETLLTIKHLRRDPDVAYAEPNYRLRSLTTPNDEAYPFQWHYPLISLPAAWDTTTGEPDVVVAVIDTGVLSGHPDLAGQLVDGYDFVRDPASAGDGDGIDPDPEDPGLNFGGGFGGFHGAHVSGTVAARGDNFQGVAGAAYSSRIMPLRALGAGGSGTSYDVNQAVRYAAGLDNDSGTLPRQPADIINLSLGGPASSEVTRNLFREVKNAGVAVVAAAGNEASASPLYPAAYDSVIAVSAVDAQRRLAPYSNTGAHIDIAAPGGNNGEDLNGDGYPDGVLSTGGTGTASGISYEYTFLSGTSMAAPHVAAVLALMKSVNSDLTPQDIDAMLDLGELSDDLGPPGRDNFYGHGLVNAQRAVLAALEAGGSSPADNPRLVASADTLNFATGTSALELALENGGKGELQLLETTVSAPWLALQPREVDGAGLGVYQISVNREGLDPGVYDATVFASSSVNNLTVRVLLTVGGADAVADVGIIYVLLIDRQTGAPVKQFPAAANEGRYDYRFIELEAGFYEIIAGTDADNDLVICDPGEACGAWLTVDRPIVIDVESDQADFDFPVEYQVSIPDISGNSQKQSTTRHAEVLPKAARARIIGNRQ
jgi:serine protease